MSGRLIKLAIVLLPVLGLLISASTALALGVGVAPGRMDFKVRPGGNQVQTLNIVNQSDQPYRFQVYIEGGNEGWFDITPAEFTLNAGEVRAVEVAVAPSLFTVPGDHDFETCILCLPPETELRVGAGVKVPTHVRVTDFPIMALKWWIATAVLLLALILGIIVGWRVRARYG
jgi:P pilus assembly chaperone PapD